MSNEENNSSNGISKWFLGLLGTIISAVAIFWLTTGIQDRTTESSENEPAEVVAENPSSPGTSARVEEPENINEPVEDPVQDSEPATELEAAKLEIERVTVENENLYSTNYGPDKTIDNNIASGNYWSTETGAIIDVALDFFLEEPSSVSEIHFLSTRNNGSYTQPQSINLIFMDNAGEKISEQEIQLYPPNREWERHDFSPVSGVKSIKLEMQDPLHDTGRYYTLNEVQFYGFPSN